MAECPPAKKARLTTTPLNNVQHDVIKPIKGEKIVAVVDWDFEDSFYINLGEGFSSAELPKICKPIMDNPIFCRLRYIRQTGVCHYVFPDTSHTRFTHSLGSAELPKICKPIMDNPIFCRLRYIRQTGVCHYVFPDTSHTRFTHSLGTAVIAYQLVRKLQKQKFNGMPPMTGSEMLCVVIAALCHDLGHGPFSHLCEELFIQEDGSHFTIRICATPDGKYNWLAFPDSDSENIRSIFDARKKLHSTVYSHKNVLAINEMFVQAFKLAGPHLKFEYGGKQITLKQCFSKDYLDLYIRLVDDYLTTLIKYSTSDHPDMIKARELIRDVEFRHFSKAILSFEGLNQHYPCLESAAIKSALKKCQLSFPIEDLSIIRRDFHGGKGLNVNPLDKVLFYGRSDETTATYIPCAPSAFESIVYIFAPYNCQESDVIEITNVISDFTEKHANLRPRRKFRNNQKENAMPYC
uniref:HD/PDEase domain-containing protein n=1 Tax=Panagrolaimus sp. ES5 TaxID=591445 RepID=A0AC34FFI4_9BILA